MSSSLLIAVNQLRRVGLGVGSEALHHFSLAAYEKLLEIPKQFGVWIGFDSIALQFFAEWNFGNADGLGLRSNQGGIQRVLLCADHRDLAEHWKFHAEVRGAEGLDLLVCARLLAFEIIRRKSGNDEALATVLLIDLSSPSYCGVRPHFDATFTTSRTLPLNSARDASSPEIL